MATLTDVTSMLVRKEHSYAFLLWDRCRLGRNHAAGSPFLYVSVVLFLFIICECRSICPTLLQHPHIHLHTSALH